MKIVKEMAKKALKLVGMTMIMLAMLQVGSVEVKADEEPDYLTFEALKDASHIGFYVNVKSDNGDYLEYQLYDGNNWVDDGGVVDEWQKINDNIPPSQRKDFTLKSGEKMRFRGKNAAVYFGGTEGDSGAVYDSYIIGKVKVYGDITTLTNVEGKIDSLVDEDGKIIAKYNEMFKAAIGLVDASGLILPSNVLSDGCYSNIFEGCTSLVNAPELPATALAASCYSNMFEGCISLVNAPDLPATTLADSCYRQMFINCTSLESAPDLPATTLAKSCYSQMFLKCESLTSAQEELPATNLEESCYFNMFKDCTALTSAPEILATTSAENCCQEMFIGCKSLTNAPSKLPATTLANYCYSSMFSGCISLTKAPDLPATTLANDCYSSMFSSCTSLTKAPDLPATILTDSCYRDMFIGCASLTKAPDLPATTLADSCYYSMFIGCKSLTKAPDLPATTLADSCYYNMFSGCSNLRRAPKLPAKKLTKNCYSSMFENCSQLEKAPDLLDLDMKDADAINGDGEVISSCCCHKMFYNCTALKVAPNITVKYLAQDCFAEMFLGCDNLEDIHGFSVPSLSLKKNCFYAMFKDCKKLALRIGSDEEFEIPWKFNAQIGDLEGDILDATYLMFTGCDVEGLEIDSYFEESKPVYILKPGETYYIRAFISNIMIDDSGNGTVTVDKPNAKGGELVTLTVKPDEGYEFDSWDVSEDVEISADNTFVMPYGNVTIKAIFKKINYSITINTDGYGTVDVPETAVMDQRVCLAPHPEEGYVFDRWESEDVEISADNTFVMPTKNVTIKALFKEKEPDTFVISITNDGHGSASANKYVAVAGESIILTASGAENYIFDRWESEDVEISADNTFVMPAKDVNIKAIFKYVEPEEPKKTVKEEKQEKKETVYVDYDTFKSELPAGTVLTMDIDNFKQFWDMKVHSLEKTVVANQKMIADFYASQMNKRAKILHTYGIYLGSEIPITDAGARKVLAWNMLSVKTPGPIYAACYNQKDGAYLVSGTVNETGTAVFFDFRLYDATNVTLFVLE